MEWIKMSNNLPKEGDIVLVSFKQIVRTAYLYKGSFYKNHNSGDNDPICFEDPIAWMKLPKPFKLKQI